MTRKYKKELTEVGCNMCGSVADGEDFESWSQGNTDAAAGQLVYRSSIRLAQTTVIDLCPGCAAWLIAEIEQGRVKRPEHGVKQD